MGEATDPSLWTRCFNHTSQWWDNGDKKTGSRYPDSIHKFTEESPWLYGLYDQPCVTQAFRRGGLRGVKDGRHYEHQDISSIVGLLKTVTNEKDLCKGSNLHAHIRQHAFLENSCFVASALISMYSRCGALARAEEVLKELPVRDVVTWNALISAYAQHGKGEQALECFDSMQQEGHCPDVVTFTCVLKACASIGVATKGEQIHDKIVGLGFLEKDIKLGNTLVDMYAKCHAFEKAQQVLDELPLRDVVTWNALIAGYAQNGQGEQALKCFESMQCEGHIPDTVTFICALKACGCTGTSAKGEQIHEKIVSLGLLGKDLVLAGSLVDMYIKCDAPAKAEKVLEELAVRDAIMWNSLIAGYVQFGQGKEAVRCFYGMQRDGHAPDAVTFTCVLKACGSIGAAAKGEQIHDMIISLGLLDKDLVLGNSLVDMYARCGALSRAQEVLQALPVRNVVSWNALISGYVQHGQGEEALKCFDAMQQEAHSPDLVTFICALKACGSIGASAKGKQIHEEIVNLDLLEKDIMLGSTLVDMYARCGALAKAQEVLEGLLVQNVVSWNALIAGLTQHGQSEEALKCFERMQHEGHAPDTITFMCLLKACGSIGAAAKGEQIHDEIVRLGLSGRDIELENTLIGMYAKCAALTKALEVLSKLPIQSTVTWNALIGGYAHQGQTGEALKCFEGMQSKGVKPDSTTLICVLIACSHSGLLDQAEMYFSEMNTKYSVVPDVEHYCCMVDLFSRAGKLCKALEAIDMSSVDYVPVWLAFLGACSKWGDMRMAKLAFECTLRLDENHAAAYVSMANICTVADMQVDANEIEVMGIAH